jgi:cytochrome c-type biogenesis protein CcmE
MRRRLRLAAGALVIVGALAYMVYAGVSQSAVYFVTPEELTAAPVAGKSYRLGGVVAPGTLAWNPRTLDLAFVLTDGKATVAVRHRGSPPDMFAEGRGAVVEGTWTPDGYFKASLILAKHSEDYSSERASAAFSERASAAPSEASPGMRMAPAKPALEAR